MQYYCEVPDGSHPDRCTFLMYFLSPKESFLKEADEIFDTDNFQLNEFASCALYKFEDMLGIKERNRDNYRAYHYKNDPTKILIVVTDDLDKDDMLNVLLLNKILYKYNNTAFSLKCKNVGEIRFQ